MNSILRMSLVLAICLIPAVAVGIVIRREKRLRRSRKVDPFKELRRRPPGEALRVKLAEFDDKFSEYLLWLVLPPALIAMSALFVPAASWVALVPLIVFSLIWTAWVGFKLLGINRERDTYRLGFYGERFVGEELNRLVAKRFEVYHDVPFGGFNIDHVLVGPPGVFSVETKTKRKPINKTGNRKYHVAFDGTCLRWPWGEERKDLDQAARNAQTLSQELSVAAGKSVQAIAILTLPGWMVDSNKSTSEGVRVLNPKQIFTHFDGQPEILNDKLINSICHQLDQKCKMEVE